MKTFIFASASTILLASSTLAFQSILPLTINARSSEILVRYGYIPDGFTASSYAALKKKEASKNQKAQNARMGPKGFKSRSMQSFQEALEKGEADHLMPMFNAKEKLKTGKIRQEDIPYMQRGGSWDNGDVKGAKKKKWLESDKKYSGGGYKKEFSSLLGIGGGLDWTGRQDRTGPKSKTPAKKKTDAEEKKSGWKLW